MEDAGWPSRPSRTTSSRTARSRRRTSFKADALVADAFALRRGRRGLRRASGPARPRELLDWYEDVAHDPRVGPARSPSGSSAASSTSATTAVDRHVDGGPGRQGRLPLGGRAGRHPHDHLRRPARRGAAVRQRAEGPRASRKGDRVAIYMPMIPELPVAMLACARIGAAHSVVFGGFSPRLARRPHQRRRGQGASSPPTAASAGARRRRSSPTSTPPLADTPDRSSTSSSCAAPTSRRRHGRRAATTGGTTSWPTPTPSARREPMDSRGPALPALHLGHDGQAQGHHAHHRRLPHPGRVHPQVRLRPPPRDRRLLVRGRHRLGHRPQLHRLRAARQRRHVGDLRGHARHPRQGPAVGHRRALRRHASSTPRPPPSARS